MKTPTTDLDKFKKLLQNKEPFAFARFSDGELHTIQGMYYKIAMDHVVQGFPSGTKVSHIHYAEDELKEFNPETDEKYRQALEDCLSYRQDNYFKGICTRSDVTEEEFRFQIEINNGYEDDLTFANLFINANYPRFIEEILPLIAESPVVFVLNKNADTSRIKHTLNIIKEFRVGSNCLQNDFDVQFDVPRYLKENNIKGAVVLCAAASLSNLVVKTGFKEYPENTYLDIGSALNPFVGLNGWMQSRGYLQHYILGQHNRYGVQVDTW